MESEGLSNFLNKKQTFNDAVWFGNTGKPFSLHTPPEADAELSPDLDEWVISQSDDNGGNPHSFVGLAESYVASEAK